MLIERPLEIIRKFFAGTVWIRPKKEKTIYLTFDDGPIPEVTPLVLDILEKHQINATFFCVGENVTKYPELYKTILSKGHRVGNHTYNHLKGFEVSLDTYIENIKKAAQVIDSNLFRPPYGRITFKQLNALKRDFEIIMWDLITRDYNPAVSPKQILRFVENLARNGSIIVFHDSLKSKHNVLTALPLVIAALKKKGYHFDTL